MELYIGGYGQGKLDYVLGIHEGENIRVVDGGKKAGQKPGAEQKIEREHAVGNFGKTITVFYRYHLWVKALLKEGKSPEEETERWLKSHENCIIISDEVGNGIVPIKREDREYRERLGRILIEVAARAERVERVICGMGQRLK